MPLFEKFQYEDWTLLSTRYELHLLLHSFKKDLNDPDRPSFGEPGLGSDVEGLAVAAASEQEVAG
eukprot:Skav235345  [mRNA]  locus=scaffold520:1253293:1253487:- [translate_table: standard]